MNDKKEKLDKALPQTQCQLCEYPGCRPYAEAMAAGTALINKCLPGGVRTLKQLGKILNINPAPYIADMQQKEKPAITAVIREHECIGCTKCIQACPVDAIIGSAKNMHTVLSDACNGCELCIEPCPIDCIDLVTLPPRDDQAQAEFSKKNRKRFEAHQARTQHTDVEKPELALDQSVNARQAQIAAMLKGYSDNADE